MKHLKLIESVGKFDLTKMLKNVSDYYNVVIWGEKGIYAPGAATGQRTVQRPVTPAHKCGNHNFHAHAISKYILINIWFEHYLQGLATVERLVKGHHY